MVIRLVFSFIRTGGGLKEGFQDRLVTKGSKSWTCERYSPFVHDDPGFDGRVLSFYINMQARLFKTLCG